MAVLHEEPFSIMPLGKLCDSVWDGGVELFQDPEPVGSSRITEADAVERMRSGTRS